MRYTEGFLRKSSSGKFVGVLKYKDEAGAWHQVTRTFGRDLGQSQAALAAWRAQMREAAARAGAAPSVGAAPSADAGSTDAARRGASMASASQWGAGPAAADPPPPPQAGGTLPIPGYPPAGPAAASQWGAFCDTSSALLSHFALPGGWTVEQAVRGQLAAQLARGRIERSTHNTQLAYAERAIFPELGGLPLAALTPAAAQQWVDRLCLRLSPGSARIAYGVLHKTCVRACTAGLLARNPLAGVEPPGRTRPARAYLPPQSVALLQEALDQRWGPAHRFTCAARLALYAGLRAGETCALRWQDVDLAGARLRVAASVGRSNDGPYLKAPKCAASARELPFVSALASTLQARASETGAHADRFVCGQRGRDDRFSDPRMLSISFARLCERAGVVDNNGRRATFHMLRHTFATRAVRAGVDVRTLADLMGHARADVTLNVYAASGEDAKLAAAARMEGAWAD